MVAYYDLYKTAPVGDIVKASHIVANTGGATELTPEKVADQAQLVGLERSEFLQHAGVMSTYAYQYFSMLQWSVWQKQKPAPGDLTKVRVLVEKYFDCLLGNMTGSRVFVQMLALEVFKTAPWYGELVAPVKNSHMDVFGDIMRHGRSTGEIGVADEGDDLILAATWDAYRTLVTSWMADPSPGGKETALLLNVLAPSVSDLLKSDAAHVAAVALPQRYEDALVDALKFVRMPFTNITAGGLWGRFAAALARAKAP